MRWPKYWSFSISRSSGYSGLISFQIDWFEILAVQGILRSLQHHYSKASVLWRSALFIVHLSHVRMSTGKTKVFADGKCVCSSIHPVVLCWVCSISAWVQMKRKGEVQGFESLVQCCYILMEDGRNHSKMKMLVASGSFPWRGYQEAKAEQKQTDERKSWKNVARFFLSSLSCHPKGSCCQKLVLSLGLH